MPHKIRSGFDDDTDLNFFAGSDGNWRAFFVGIDQVSNLVWYNTADGSSDLIGGTDNRFAFQVDDGQTLEDYVVCEIRTGEFGGRDDGPGLYLQVTEDDPVNTDVTRAKYQIRPGRTAYNGGPYTEGYASVWFKLQSDLASVQTSGWRELFSLTNDAQDKSVSFQVVVVGGSFRWRLLGKPCIGDCESDWTEDNTTVAVPIDQWFQVEQAWSPTYIGVKINGVLVAEHASPYITDIRSWDVISCYSAVTEDAAGMIYQQNDDLEVRLGPGSIPHEWTRGRSDRFPQTTTGGPERLLREGWGRRKK